MRIYIAAAIYQVGHHFFLTRSLDKIVIECSLQLEDKWIAKDIAKVKKFGRDQIINKLKRKERKNMTLKVEVKKRKEDITKSFTYESRVGFDDGILIQKEKEVAANVCKHMCLGCDTFPRHKIERNNH